ncbi:MAG: cupin domain-containing protein [Rudaea sp.]
MSEVRASAKRPLGMAPASFLRDYWQKRPLLIRGFAGDGIDSVGPDDLAGLACEEAALSRIVSHDRRRDRFKLRNGPFTDADFAALGTRDWTLLVQDVDKWDADVAALLERFAFVPSWRIDDVMISYATQGGGVGPHVDQYDVFLIQGMGRRRWRIDEGTRSSHAFREDSELRLLKHFVPTRDWLLEPGDALYLPPGIPHDGVAAGECMTWSVGMRAPAQAELLLDFAEFLAEPLGETRRYADPDLSPACDKGEIDGAALQRVRAAIPQFAGADDATLRSWFGRFITRYRSAQFAALAPRRLGADELLRRLPGALAMRNPFSRIAWIRQGRAAELFVAGDAWRCSLGLARLVASDREIAGDRLVAECTSATAQAVLVDLFRLGHLQIARRPPRPRAR